MFILQSDESQLIIGGGKGTVALVEVATGTILREASIQEHAILSLKQHPTQDLVLAGAGIGNGSNDGNGMTLFKASDFTVIHHFEGHNSYVRDVGWLSENTCMSTSADGKILGYTVTSTTPIQIVNTEENIWSTAISPDYSIIIAGTGISKKNKTGTIYFVNVLLSEWEIIRIFNTPWNSYISALYITVDLKENDEHQYIQYLLACGSGNGRIGLLSLEVG
jgi:hypothetical protein